MNLGAPDAPMVTFPAVRIPAIPAAVSVELERVEFERLIETLRGLPGDAWSVPIPGRGGDVRALVAHIAGSYAAQSKLSELRRQADPWVHRFYRANGESIAQTVARIQIGDRLTRTPTQLIHELEHSGPRAINLRERVFRPVSALMASSSTTGGYRPVALGPFTAVRDLWFHRLEITSLASLPMRLSSNHDKYIVEQLVRVTSARANRHLSEHRVDLTVDGPAGGEWRYGEGAGAPDARIEIDPIALAKLIAGWRSAAATRERCQMHGDVKLAMAVLRGLQPQSA